jgi:hypothetical protein
VGRIRREAEGYEGSAGQYVPWWVYQEVAGLRGGATWEEGLVGEEVRYEGHVGGVVGACVKRA